MVELPKILARLFINFGCFNTAVFILILSAPDLRIFFTSSTFLMPPPAVMGIKMSFKKI